MNPKIDPSKNPTVEHHVRQFLHELNSGGGKPLETLTPAEARQVLVSAQKGRPSRLAMSRTGWSNRTH